MANDPTAFNALVLQIQNNEIGPDINLHQAGLTDADGISLANALRNNTSVKTLDLSRNSFQEITALADALKTNNTLQSLNLSANALFSGGAILIAQALRVNTQLQALNLGSTSINQAGATALAQMLRVNTHLRSLDLSGNLLGNGMVEIAQALQVNPSLQTLIMSSNPSGLAHTTSMLNAFQCNYVLTTFAPPRTMDIPTFTSILDRNEVCVGRIISVSYKPCPTLLYTPVMVPRNNIMPLNSNILQIATPLQHPSYTDCVFLDGNFSISTTQNGQFINAASQVITQFSQSMVNANQVYIQTDNSGLPFICNITASFGNLATCVIPLMFNVSDISTTSLASSSTLTTNTPSTATTQLTSASSTSTATTLLTSTSTSSTSSSTISTSTSTASTVTSPTTMTLSSTPFTTSSTLLTMSPTSTTSISTTSTAMPLTSTLFTSITRSTTNTLPQTTGALTSTSHPTTTSVAANVNGKSGFNIAPIIGGAAAGVAAVGAAVFALRRYRRKNLAQVSALPTNTIDMADNPLYSIPLDQPKWDPAVTLRRDAHLSPEKWNPDMYITGSEPAATLRRDAKAVPAAWAPNLYTTAQPATVVTGNTWDPTRYATGQRAPHVDISAPYETADDDFA